MEREEREEIFEGKWYAHPPMRNALISGLLTGTSFGLAYLGIIPEFVEAAVYAVAILLGGYHWSREGVEEFIEEREIGIEILMMAATVGSVILGLWDEAAFLVFLYGTAEGLEEYAYARTRASIRRLLDLAPKEARVLKDGEEVTVLAEEVRVGDIFLVRPGESIPTDGIVMEGSSSVNEAPVTGESVPVEKREGMKVFAGAINQEGALVIRATATFKDNTLSKMIHLVEEAQEQKGKAQLFIEKFGRKYSPMVLLSAFLLVLVPLLLGAPLSHWANRAVVLLVAAAPCALVMSTPVAIAAGIGRAGRSGVLIKGGSHLENLGEIKVVAFDKTRTLTRGEPSVTDIVPLNGDESSVLDLAYSLAKYSEHPLSRAIVRKGEEAGAKSLPVVGFTSIAGYGVRAVLRDRTVYLGKEGLFRKFDGVSRFMPPLETLRKQGKTVILVGTEKSIDGIIAIRDGIRPEAEIVIRELHGMGVKVIMLTGDNEVTAMAIAEELGLDDLRAGLRPEAKVQAVRELEERYGAVAMVGDGINDAPALAQATVGIAM
ncbi:MAG: heavy metal translocating P-type ATPase, partial [Desulfatiglandales bacterium]